MLSVMDQVWTSSVWLGEVPSRKQAAYDLLAQSMAAAAALGVQVRGGHVAEDGVGA